MKAFFPSLALGASLFASFLFPGPSIGLAPESPAAHARRYGAAFELDKPFYHSGDVLSARFVLANGSRQEAYGFSPQAGGNGCQYQATVSDSLGNVVWAPGSIFNGMYSGPGCLFRFITFRLSPGSSESAEFPVPLIYQNPNGLGVLGSPLAPGSYSLDIMVNFGGPERLPRDSPLGKNFSGSIPFTIEP